MVIKRKYIYLLIIAVLVLTALTTYCFVFFNNKAVSSNSIEYELQDEISDSSAVIDINTSKSKPIEIGMTGFHSEKTGAPYSLVHPASIKQAAEYNELGFIRNAGTNINVFNWKTGAMDEEMLGQYSFEPEKYYMYTEHGRILEARGYETMEDLREFLQQTGTKLNIAVNPFYNTPETAGDLAKYCYDNHIPVTHFDLGNEVYMFTAEAGFQRPQQFKTGEDYLDRMRLFNDQIKANYPGAKTVAAMSNDQNKKFDEDFRSFQKPYWDAVAFHKFNGDGDTLDAAVRSANETFEKWISQINGIYLPRLPDPKTPILLQEHSVTLGGRLALTHYNGIVVAENTLRFSMHPNIHYTQSFRLQGGIANVEDFSTYVRKLKDAYQRKLSVDTNKWNLVFKDGITSISLRVVDGAVNNSNEAWETKITGGTTVPKSAGTIGALYAQAYRGINGKDYVVIVNKSSKSQNVTIKKDGVKVKAAMSKYCYSNNNPAAKEEVKLPVETATANPVNLPGYSVTRVEWQRTNKKDIPPVPWISHADSGSNQVDLKWLKVINADGYTVKYGTSPDKLTNTIDAGNTDHYTIKGLTNGTRYYFAVSAYNSSGKSNFSNEVIQNGAKVNEISVKLDKPDAPVITKASPEKSGRIIVEWQSVPGAKGYKLKYGTSPKQYTGEIDAGNNLGYIVKELENDLIYYFSIAAYNGMGFGEDSAEASAVPKSGLPLAPNNLMLLSEIPNDITLSWQKTKSEQLAEYFEDGRAINWKPAAGLWSITDHPDRDRETNVYKSSTEGVAISILQAGSPKEDQMAEVTIEKARTKTNSQAGVIGKFKDINNYYRFVYVGTDSTFQLLKVENGAETVLKSVPAGKINSDSMIMRLHFHGDEIKAEYGARNIATLKDGSIKEGYIGIYTNNQEALFDEMRVKSDNAKFVNIYRSEHPYTGFIKINTVPGTLTNYTDTVPDASKKYYYRVTAENDAGESYGYSNTLRKN